MVLPARFTLLVILSGTYFPLYALEENDPSHDFEIIRMFLGPKKRQWERKTQNVRNFVRYLLLYIYEFECIVFWEEVIALNRKFFSSVSRPTF